LRGKHAGVLELLEGLSRINALMLPRVTNEQNPVLGS